MGGLHCRVEYAGDRDVQEPTTCNSSSSPRGPGKRVVSEPDHVDQNNPSLTPKEAAQG